MPPTRLTRSLRLAGVTAALGTSLLLGGCGFDAQTLQAYVPAQGVNVDVLAGPKVRNLLIIANAAGHGRVSASLLADGKADQLTAITGTAKTPNGAAGAALTVGPASVPLPAGKLVVLTAELTLAFGSGARQTITVPVMDAKDPIYASVAPELA